MAELRGAGVRGGMLVSTAWLAEYLHDPNVRVVDMRGVVATVMSAQGEQTAVYRGRGDAYAEGHIPGAVYLDWTTDLVDLDDPIPAQAAKAAKLAEVLGSRGIGDGHLVVVYDDSPVSQFATRLWWLLNYYGHNRIAVVNGGFPKWQRENRPVTTEVPSWPRATFTPRVQPAMRVEAAEIVSVLDNPSVRLLDARDAGQYTGATRRGRFGGHIPGAINVPRELVADPSTGEFRSDAELDDVVRLADLDQGERVIAYCNGGVAATSVLFTLALRGYPLAKLANYDGSWNEWGNRDDVPVVTGSEP